MHAAGALLISRDDNENTCSLERMFPAEVARYFVTNIMKESRARTVFGRTVNAAKGFNRYRPFVADNCRRQRPKPPVTYDKLQVMPGASMHPCVSRAH